MARKASKTASAPARRKTPAAKSSGSGRGGGSGSRSKSSGSSSANAGDAFIKLLQSPLVADLLAVAATAALAALAEHGFSSRGDSSGGKRAGRAVKEAGKAAAAAIGRRLSTEIDEIRKASDAAKGGAKA
jgi:hypothetical protein